MLTSKEQEILDNAPDWAVYYTISGGTPLYFVNINWGFKIADLRKKQEKPLAPLLKKLTSKDIDWNDDDVCAYVATGTNKVLVKFAVDVSDGNITDAVYIVMRDKEEEIYRPIPALYPECKINCDDGKTVVDAVNYFNGEISSRYKTVIETVKKDPHYPGDLIGSLHGGGGDPDEHYNVICTIEEFNQCVKEMVCTSDEDSRLGYLSNRSPLTKENSDYSFYGEAVVCELAEIMSKIANNPPLEPVKSVYTQAMKDAGELPSVGMLARIIDPTEAESYPIEIVQAYRGDLILYRHPNTTKLHDVDVMRLEEIRAQEPIDTRTPEQKQVDELHEFTLKHGRHMDMLSMIKKWQKLGFLAEIK